MKTLLILRHAKSSWKDTSLSDHERGLNKRGQHDAPRMGKELLANGIGPDVILSSSAVRARTTAELFSTAIDFQGDLHVLDKLYSFEVEPYLEVIAQAPDESQRLMVVGHNPAVSELLSLLIEKYHELPTAALAEVALDLASWSEFNPATRGRLVRLLRPRDLPARA